MTNEELLDIIRSLKAHHLMYHPMCQRRDDLDKFAARAFGENAPPSETSPARDGRHFALVTKSSAYKVPSEKAARSRERTTGTQKARDRCTRR